MISLQRRNNKEKEKAMARANENIPKKATRLAIVRRIQEQHRVFPRLKRAEKQALIEKVTTAIIGAESGGENFPRFTDRELLGLEAVPAGILSIEKMASFIGKNHITVLPLDSPIRRRAIGDPFLKALDTLLIDGVVDKLLAPSGYTPRKRSWRPSQLLRMELLRSYRFGSWSVRDFCAYTASVYRKEERAFCKLPLYKSNMCDHSVLSRFRSSLTLEMRINLTVYFLHYFLKSGRLSDRQMHIIDSTDVAIPINDRPIVKLKAADDTLIRFYSDLEADVGARRRKRDKSNKFIGYRVHTISVGDIKTGIAYPIVSLVAAASHNDMLFLEPLVELCRAMGIEMKVLSADKAYTSAPRSTEMKRDYDLVTVTPAMGNVKVPKSVNNRSGAVFKNADCETPMRWVGFDEEDKVHVFKCADDTSCPVFYSCDRERLLNIDTGYFGIVPKCSKYQKDALFYRKIAERPFNVMKHKDGLDPCRMKTFKTVSAQVVFSQIVGLTHVIAGLRSRPRTGVPLKQEVLAFVR